MAFMRNSQEWIGSSAPRRAVSVLMVMHLAIAVVTYNLLVHVATVGSDNRRTPHQDRDSNTAT